MLKLLPLLFIISPIASAIAQEVDNSDLKDHVNNTDNGSESSENPELNEQELFFQQCYQQVPRITARTSDLDSTQIPVSVDADSLKGLDGEIIYQGDVNLVQGDKSLNTDKLVYNRNTAQANAIGNARYVDGQITLLADQIDTNFRTDESSIFQTEFQFHGQGGRGSADQVHDNGKGFYELKSSNYTACPPNDITWSLDASTLYIDQEEDMGTAWNAVLRIKDVPVFYFPYISYPLSDTRKTGVLFPTYEFSSINGVTYKQPIYINIAPNQDATLTPTYMQNRGLLVAAEYRYLFGIGSGTAQVEYLTDDRIRKDDNGNDIGDRYLVHLDHSVNFAESWSFNADYNKVSDEFYFSDISTDYGTRSDNQLLQTAKLSYTEYNWNSELEVRNFQVLENDGDDDSSHIVLPKLAFNVHQPLNWKSLQFDLYSEVTRFTHDDNDVFMGTRVHVEPKISLPLYYDSLFVNTELKYMLSYYEQDLDNATKYDWYDDLEETEFRNLPSFKINSGINLERDLTWFGGEYRQTLVPQLQYLYVPYQDQSGIGLYDTTTLQQDYYGLFRDNRFSGYDRIAEADQLTFGVSTSFLNAQGREKLRFAVGQNYYFSQSRTVLPSDDNDDDDGTEINKSSIVAELDVNFENDYFYHAGIEWNSDRNFIRRANSTFEKRWVGDNYMQLSYRYYKDNEDAEWDEIVNQVGTKVNWSISTQWSTFASYYYNVDYDNSFESIVGIKYQSCCWAIGLTYDQHLLPYYGNEASYDDDVETERSVSLTLELKGLGGVGTSGTDDGLFDYGRPFYLK